MLGRSEERFRGTPSEDARSGCVLESWLLLLAAVELFRSALVSALGYSEEVWLFIDYDWVIFGCCILFFLHPDIHYFLSHFSLHFHHLSSFEQPLHNMMYPSLLSHVTYTFLISFQYLLNLELQIMHFM